MQQYDFTGGYNSSLSPENTPPNMLISGTNWYWKGNLRKRPGWTNLSTDATIHAGTTRGFCRAYLNSTWMNIVALDNDSEVTFYRGDTGAYTEITYLYNPITDGAVSMGTSTLWDMTTGYNVEMVFMPELNVVVAVNGVDKPKIIFYADSQYVVCDLDEYDVRSWPTDEWYAGQYTGGDYTDDTTDAQDNDADDFQVFSTTNTEGMYISCVNPFNFVHFTDFNPSAAAGTIVIEYYAGSGSWTALTPDYSRYATNHSGGSDFTGTSEVDVYLKYDLPFAADGTLLWETYGDVSTQTDPTGVTGGLLNKYVLRIRAGSAPASASSAETIAVYHTQYLTQLFLNTMPQAVCVHNDRLFLAAENAFRYTPPRQAKNWYSYHIEGCLEGGNQILQLVSCGEYMAAIKAGRIYAYYGTTTDNFVLREINVDGGVSKRGAAYISGALAYVAKDGIRVLVNEKSVRVTRHIQSDYDGWTKTDAAMISWDGNALIMFPTDGVILWCDPDTLRTSQTDSGEGMASFWYWTELDANCGVYARDSNVVILYDSTNARFVKDSSNGYDTDYDTTTDNVVLTLQTKYYSYETPGNRKIGRRLLVDLLECGDWTLTLYADNGERYAQMTIETGDAGYHAYYDITPPYTLDGFNLSIKLENDTSGDVVFYGFTDEQDRRPL